jgi:cardiolipin synthase A/B
MKFFKAGFWQKLVMALLVVIQVAFLITILYFFASNLLESGYAFAFIVAIWLFSAVLELMILFSQSEVDYRLAWMFVVAVLPLFGGVFYLFFANKKITRRQKKKLTALENALHGKPTSPEVSSRLCALSPDAERISHYIENASGSGIYENSQVSYFSLGDEAFPAMLEELKKARHYIFLEYFILSPGKMWDSILEVLKEKVKEGLDVRLIYDDIGNLGTVPVDYEVILQSYGIKAHAFAPIKPFINIKMNNRDHRKIMVIDGHTCFTGGINLADEYINEEIRFGHWKDNAIMIKGEAVHGFTMLFLSNWIANYGGAETIDFSLYQPTTHIEEAGGMPQTDGFVQPYGDLPYDREAVGEKIYTAILNRAKKYVYMSTPYLIPDESMHSAIVAAAEQGVDTIILTPGIPDKKAVYELTRRSYGSLLSAGVKIYEYTPGFVHQKMFVSDDVIATDGTINLDYRSLFLHLECGTFLVGCHAIANMKQDFIDTIAVSHEVTLAEWEGWHRKKRLWWAILSLLAPLL